MDFVEALFTNNLNAIRTAPKTDVHCHAFFSTRLENVERWIEHSLTKPPPKMDGLEEMMAYADAVLASPIKHREGFEFGGAEEVRRTVEVLDLDEVQHGIGAAESVEVMRWLSENQIQLNVCPTSNVMLDAVRDLASHPIRALYDNGVPVTINTDDLMIFGQSVSEEYRNLYRAGVFSVQELEDIRRASLVGATSES